MGIKEVVEAGRITVDIGVRAYQETGIIPLQFRHRSCGMGVISTATQLPFRGLYIGSTLVCHVHGALADILGAPYVLGFMSGFDGYGFSEPVVIQWCGEGTIGRCYEGHEDGRRLWEAVKDGVPPVESGASESPGEVQKERELVLA